MNGIDRVFWWIMLGVFVSWIVGAWVLAWFMLFY